MHWDWRFLRSRQRQQGGSFGHGYAIDNPAVSSDVIALLRYGRPPGEENGRPLKHLGENFWGIDDEYMIPRRVIVPKGSE